MFRLTWRDVLAIARDQLKQNARDVVTSQLFYGFLIGAAVASVVWAAVVFGR